MLKEKAKEYREVNKDKISTMNERRNGQREGPEGGGAGLALLWSKK